ncbi:hypothetical protein [Formosa sp. L2A11]|uniref:hypothetical protein n=1 Tax=Formosa sp. L2A11 TaxID=2686363 RepID=UPI00131D0EE8|nr:hypothetical protein [Formosa sp. L2A11]
MTRITKNKVFCFIAFMVMFYIFYSLLNYFFYALEAVYRAMISGVLTAIFAPRVQKKGVDTQLIWIFLKKPISIA